jgi:hypothetical protein
LGTTWPRDLDLSGWQISAGWQFDLRTLSKASGFGGSWMLTRVDGVPIPTTLQQERAAGGGESSRQEIVSAYLDLDPRAQIYSLRIVTRTVTLSPNGVAQALRFDTPMLESGNWRPAPRATIRLTPSSGGGESVGRRADDEIVIEHQTTGRRLYFRKVKTT